MANQYRVAAPGLTRGALLGATSALLLAVTPAAAQELDATDGAADPGDIVVTAQRRSESVRDVPMSITALSSDTLANLGVKGTEDLAKIIPGSPMRNPSPTRPSTRSAASV